MRGINIRTFRSKSLLAFVTVSFVILFTFYSFHSGQIDIYKHLNQRRYYGVQDLVYGDQDFVKSNKSVIITRNLKEERKLDVPSSAVNLTNNSNLLKIHSSDERARQNNSSGHFNNVKARYDTGPDYKADKLVVSGSVDTFDIKQSSKVKIFINSSHERNNTFTDNSKRSRFNHVPINTKRDFLVTPIFKSTVDNTFTNADLIKNRNSSRLLKPNKKMDGYLRKKNKLKNNSNKVNYGMPFMNVFLRDTVDKMVNQKQIRPGNRRKPVVRFPYREALGRHNLIDRSFELQNRYDEIKKTIYKSKLSMNKTLQTDNEVINESLPVRNESCSRCFKNDFNILLNQNDLCSEADTIDILILISSSPGDFNERRAIRETWGSNCNHENSSMKLLFVIGNTRNIPDNNRQSPAIPGENNITSNHSENTFSKVRLQKESFIFKDIVQIDFVDSYGNLTYKTLSGISWAVKFCSKAKYIMKTDTDMFVNTELLPFLIHHAPKKEFVGGYCWGPSSPNRDLLSKWFVSYNSYRKPQFPPMCSGTGYIMSSDVASSILRKARNIPFFHLEDVYIALCLKKLNIEPLNLYGFSNIRPEFDACFYKSNVVTSHYMTPENLYEFWQPIKSCSFSVLPVNVFREVPLPYVS
ncbi:beta-1,3-galactosyltransferase 1 [Mytilus galloprovincialis]|uniref:Beta-1,3-galactosyltransferase 1 n=2 Tax=Mytilus galloprovincialis TaxID=29158 RepID=A0A8B6GWX0_MYTGA|nr:beta-1,3-galactosyltransferase 1 [Mytilus galloprovincialis]